SAAATKADQGHLLLSKAQHHVIIATPGRPGRRPPGDTKGLRFAPARFLVLDEAIGFSIWTLRTRSLKFKRSFPATGATFLFISATMTKTLGQTATRQPSPIQSKWRSAASTAQCDKLSQYYLFIPAKLKDHYLAYLLQPAVRQHHSVHPHQDCRPAGWPAASSSRPLSAVPLHGQMAQNKRHRRPNKFRARDAGILVATDVASRGLDIPPRCNDYVHRDGRTAPRPAGGKVGDFMFTQYDVQCSTWRVETGPSARSCRSMRSPGRGVRLGDQLLAKSQRIAKMELQDLMKGRQAKKRRGAPDDDGTTDEDAARRHEAADFDKCGGRRLHKRRTSLNDQFWAQSGLDKMLVDDFRADVHYHQRRRHHSQAAGDYGLNWAQLQDEKVGDGTTSVVLVAAELLSLMSLKIQPTTITLWLRLGLRREAFKFINERLVISVDDFGQDNIVNAAKTSMSSKIIGCDAPSCSPAILASTPPTPQCGSPSDGKGPPPTLTPRAKVSATGPLHNVEIIIGTAFATCKSSKKNQKMMKLGVQLVIETAEQLELMRAREARAEDHGVGRQTSFLTTGQSIDDLCMHVLTCAKPAPWPLPFAGARRFDFEAHRPRHRRPVRGALHDQLTEGEESFDASLLGHREAERVAQERGSDRADSRFRMRREHRSAQRPRPQRSGVARDEMETPASRRRVRGGGLLEGRQLVPAAGRGEVALNIYLENYLRGSGETYSPLRPKQLACPALADGHRRIPPGALLLWLPKLSWALNAPPSDSTELAGAELRARHNASQVKKDCAPTSGELRAFLFAAGPAGKQGSATTRGLRAGAAVSKIKSLKFATEAAITILRIDDQIKVTRRAPPSHGGH
uniref:Helicase C-terminal domain-containing protein n=1 Tax=Macrostomum lignano TaxID=282301 RepID=A0A1I8FAX5_9PLAT